VNGAGRDFAAGAGISLCHVRGALFVPYEQMLDIASFEKQVQERKKYGSWMSEYVLHTFSLKAAIDNLGPWNFFRLQFCRLFNRLAFRLCRHGQSSQPVEFFHSLAMKLIRKMPMMPAGR